MSINTLVPACTTADRALPEDFSSNATSATLPIEGLCHERDVAELAPFANNDWRWFTASADIVSALPPLTLDSLDSNIKPANSRTRSHVVRRTNAQELKQRILHRRKMMQKRAEDELKRGNEYFNYQRYEDALKHYEQALDAMPHFADARIAAGNALFRLGRLEEAAIRFEQVAIFHPEKA